jgi:hypothetical protein
MQSQLYSRSLKEEYGVRYCVRRTLCAIKFNSVNTLQLCEPYHYGFALYSRSLDLTFVLQPTPHRGYAVCLLGCKGEVGYFSTFVLCVFPRLCIMYFLMFVLCMLYVFCISGASQKSKSSLYFFIAQRFVSCTVETLAGPNYEFFPIVACFCCRPCKRGRENSLMDSKKCCSSRCHETVSASLATNEHRSENVLGIQNLTLIGDID